MVSLVLMVDSIHPSAPIANGELVGSKEMENAANYSQNGHVHGQILGPPAQNGAPSMPPQQVYLNPSHQHIPTHHDMMGLENQLRAMGMDPSDPRGMEAQVTGEHVDEGDNDEETNDEDPLKLFVGQVRLTTNGKANILVWAMLELRFINFYYSHTNIYSLFTASLFAHHTDAYRALKYTCIGTL